LISESPKPLKSDFFVYKNYVFRQTLALGKPLKIEEVYLKACQWCQYVSFTIYFDDFVKLVKDKNFDPDCIVHVDESTTSAAETKASKSVFCVKELVIACVIETVSLCMRRDRIGLIL
jgi:hypothetical protein